MRTINTQPTLPAGEEERLEELHRYAILDTPPEPAYDAIADIARKSLQTPVALFSLVDRDRQWFKSASGMDFRETPRDWAVCAHTICRKSHLMIEDLKNDWRFVDNPMIQAEDGPRAYLGVPIVTPRGHALGTVCVLDMKARTFTDDNISVLHNLATLAADEMELRLLNRQVDRALIDAEHADAAKTQILSTISHELRTPLNGVIGSLDILEKQDCADEMQDIIDIGRHAAQRLYDIVDDLIEAANIEYNPRGTRKDWFDPAALLRTVARNFSCKISDSVDLQLVLHDSLPGVLHGDERKLKKVLNHVLSNAVKFTHAGTIRISAETRQDRLVIEVKDTGEGMPDHILNGYLQPFVQDHAVLTRRHEGMGLGLHLCRNLCSQMDGQLEFRPNQPRGTCVSISIPVTAHCVLEGLTDPGRDFIPLTIADLAS